MCKLGNHWFRLVEASSGADRKHIFTEFIVFFILKNRTWLREKLKLLSLTVFYQLES